jgi:hypothetical protein
MRGAKASRDRTEHVRTAVGWEGAAPVWFAEAPAGVRWAREAGGPRARTLCKQPLLTSTIRSPFIVPRLPG